MAGDGIYTCPYHYGKVVSQDWGQLCYHYYCCYYYCCYQPAMTAITPAICNLYIYILIWLHARFGRSQKQCFENALLTAYIYRVTKLQTPPQSANKVRIMKKPGLKKPGSFAWHPETPSEVRCEEAASNTGCAELLQELQVCDRSGRITSQSGKAGRPYAHGPYPVGSCVGLGSNRPQNAAALPLSSVATLRRRG
jgi:hypothetical protein